LCSHASGRNAAIFRPLEEDAALADLARRSLGLLRELSPGAPLVETNGLVLLHDKDEPLERIRETALDCGFASQLLSPTSLSTVLGGLALHGSLHGLYSAAGGVIDIHALAELLAARCRTLGVELRTNAAVIRLLTNGERVVGVQTREREPVPATDVVLAAGAWAASIASSIGCELPLAPVRRHLALLQPTRQLRARLPAVWKLTDEVYFRCEGDRILASPCDETAWRPESPVSELESLAPLARKLSKIDLALGEASVVRHWACLRTFAPDRRPVVGTDSRVAGLHWLGGLGGFGMTAGLAAGQLLAGALLDGQQPPELSPARLVALVTQR
jgi:glycine/D-amino acid oxidase-like deaminating enzyme